MKAIKKALATSAIAGGMIFSLAACSNEEGLRLTNGDQPFLTTSLEEISNQQAFEAMLSRNGAGALMDLVDFDILSSQFEVNHEGVAETLATIQEANSDDWEGFMLLQGFSADEEIVRLLELEDLRQQAARASIVITDEELQEFYDFRFPAELIGEETEEAEYEEEAEETNEEANEPVERPALAEVEDQLREELVFNRLTATVIQQELARRRVDAGLVILDPYLKSLYENFLTGNSVNIENLSVATNETSQTVAARVGDVEITADDLFEELVPVVGLTVGVSLADPAILRESFAVEQSAVRALTDQYKLQFGAQFYPAMAAQGLQNDDEIFAHFELLLLQEAAFNQTYNPSEERLQELYEAFHPNISARHILVETEEEAKDLIARIEAADDVEAIFIELATEYSMDPGSGAQGGDLGSFQYGMMVPTFNDAAFALEVGEFTHEPVESQFGFHIIYKYDADERPVFEDIAEELRSQELANLYNDNVARLERILINLRAEAQFSFANARLQERYDFIVANILENAEAAENNR